MVGEEKEEARAYEERARKRDQIMCVCLIYAQNKVIKKYSFHITEKKH